MKSMEQSKEIKLKNVKTCNYCSAYADGYCRLGYSVSNVSIDKAKTWLGFTTWEDAVIKQIPDEPCPKPRNIKEVLRISKLIDVHRHGKPNPNDEYMTKEQSLHHYINYKRK